MCIIIIVMMNETDKKASKYLGKKIASKETYTPSFLVAVPRQENRTQYNIYENKLPFTGKDIWHAYEFSSLTNSGVPVTRLMKMNYSCESKFIVESKSLKLYLNSFNMTRNGGNIEECLDICREKIEKDLSNCLKTEVKINFINNHAKIIQIFSKYEDILNKVNESELKIEQFKEAPQLLEAEETENKSEYYFKFDSLRSNCRVTHQPDFGDVFIYYKSKTHIKEDSIIKYLCSFRSEYHFHEECCEMIYKRLYDLLGKDDELMVCALYTRRGGIDICPVRYSQNFSNNDIDYLINIKEFARSGIKQ